MSRRLRRILVVWVLPAVLVFTAVYTLRTNGDHLRGSPPSVNGNSPSTNAPASGDAAPIAPGRPLDLTAPISGYEGAEPTLLVTEEAARTIPPEYVRDCAQFMEWAQQQGGMPVNINPVHLLSLTARDRVDVEVVQVEAEYVRDVEPPEEEHTWVELSCRDAEPRESTSPTDAPAPGGADQGSYPLNAGQTLEHLVNVDEVQPPDSGRLGWHDPFEYYLEVELLVDGVPQVHRLANGSTNFRCCGRTTFMGYQSAGYEWTLTPTRTLRYCAELRYSEQPPPRTCTPWPPD
ncbi:hypothetical protein BDK92_7495 [Micromonospora pisi]|uniref:Uncharacterized protein n=1 Tax=Micromonospora pisi TaxID=589240 RepID=A0A495JWN4_9ACTN|nr:hypothetical protein [Micromonospora pisi]RKR92998.1 hypothetical protein BDK92_7495 [Micromonospora pisi]